MTSSRGHTRNRLGASLCLIFDQTTELFKKWLMYGIGTLFSMAVLAMVTSICLTMMTKIGAAVWSAKFVNSMMKIDSEGLSSQSMQQGGIGLLLTVLIVSVPPLAAMFFQGTMGNFLTYSAFGAGGNRLGPQGQPPGSHVPPAHTRTAENQASTGGFSTHVGPRNAPLVHNDAIKKSNA